MKRSEALKLMKQLARKKEKLMDVQYEYYRKGNAICEKVMIVDRKIDKLKRALGILPPVYKGRRD